MSECVSKNKLFKDMGRLSVKDGRLIDCCGDVAVLHGISSIGIAWYPEYICRETFTELRDKWGLNLIRLTMYTEENGGYCSDGNKEQLKAVLKSGVNYATELGMYAIIDWHILSDGNPNQNKNEAKSFFAEMSECFKNYDNVLYEICNEPNGKVSWADIKSYACEIIPIIKANSPSAVIMVGTPTWSQDVDVAANDPISEYDNLLYSLHFYAASHGQTLRSKLALALNKGLPVFVNEFSICDASGSGEINYEEGNLWIKFLSERGISYCLWNLSRKNETSAVIKPECTKLSGFADEDISAIAKWYIKLQEN